MTLDEAIADLMNRDRVLIGVDFDGTLAPLVDHPDQAVPDRDALVILRRLAALTGVTVAVVSGRAHSDLAEKLGHVSGAVLIGEHGNDTGGPAEPSVILARAKRLVADLSAEVGPLTVEEKRRSVTLHTRGLADEVEADVIGRVRKWVSDEPDVALLEGKKVLELTTADRTKGNAIDELGESCDGTMYIGDDTTDETVFASLDEDDIGIKVGDGPTTARFRVDDVPDVVVVLEKALAGRTGQSWHS